MTPDGIRLLILSKLADGRLPTNSNPRVWAGPGNGEICDGCDTIVTKTEFLVEATPLAGGPLQLHAQCFWVWEYERRPRRRAAEVTQVLTIA